MASAESKRQEVPEKEAQVRPTVSMEYEMEEGKVKFQLEIPISDRLQGDLNKSFPLLPAATETPFDLEKRKKYLKRIADYLDAAIRITPEAQEPYRAFLKNDSSTFMFAKGDFAYFYGEDDKGVAFGRGTADKSGAVLLQGFSLQVNSKSQADSDNEIFSVGALYKQPNQDAMVYASIGLNTSATLTFIEEMLSELSPQAVRSFNIRNPFDPPVEISPEEKERRGRVLNPLVYPKIHVEKNDIDKTPRVR